MFFSVNRLHKLSPSRRIEKIIHILKKAEKDIAGSEKIYSSYLVQAINTLLPDLENRKKQAVSEILEKLPEICGRDEVVLINSLKHIMLTLAGKEPAEWDLNIPDSMSDEIPGRLLPLNVFLDNVRSPFNVGSVFRTAESFCFSSIFLSQNTPDPGHPRALRSAMGTTEKVKWERRGIEMLPEPVFALETGGICIRDFEFPEKGTIIIGSEETGVSPGGIKKALKGAGIVTIPVYGSKSSINLGVAFGIAAYSWVEFILENEKAVY